MFKKIICNEVQKISAQRITLYISAKVNKFLYSWLKQIFIDFTWVKYVKFEDFCENLLNLKTFSFVKFRNSINFEIWVIQSDWQILIILVIFFNRKMWLSSFKMLTSFIKFGKVSKFYNFADQAHTTILTILSRKNCIIFNIWKISNNYLKF